MGDKAGDRLAAPIAVLLVDDDPTILEAHTLRLEREGFEITAADGAQAALARLRERAYEVAVLDLVMPHPKPGGDDRRTGLWLLQQIKATPEWTATEVIILTGFGSESSAGEAMRLGAFTYADKSPQGITILPNMIRHAALRRRTYAINAMLWERLKNALAIVQGSAPYMAQDPEFLKAVRIHARRAAALAHLSELTAPEAPTVRTLQSGRSTWASVLEGVAATLEALAENNGARLEIAPPCAAEINVDVEAIQNCLIYLTADVREGIAHSALSLQSRCEEGHLLITLEDDGDPLAEGRPGPAGLPAVKAIIEAHGGDIAYHPLQVRETGPSGSVEPAGEPGAGKNQFIVRLPLA